MVATLMVVGFGFGLAAQPLTDTVMAAVPVEDAGVGSAVNDVSRELGSALGVAIIGSIVSHLYRNNIHDKLTGRVPAQVVDIASEGIGVIHVAANSIQPDSGSESDRQRQPGVRRCHDHRVLDLGRLHRNRTGNVVVPPAQAVASRTDGPRRRSPASTQRRTPRARPRSTPSTPWELSSRGRNTEGHQQTHSTQQGPLGHGAKYLERRRAEAAHDGSQTPQTRRLPVRLRSV